MEESKNSQSHPGISSLQVGTEEDFGYTNWHTVSAGIEATIGNLSNRSIEELVAALGQLEAKLPELSVEMGQARDTLYFDPVGPVKKVAAMVFSKYFPQLLNIVRRAELREEAKAKLKSLQRVLGHLRELRQNLTDKIDELLGLKLHELDLSKYNEFQEIKKLETTVKSYLARIELLKKNIGDLSLVNSSKEMFFARSSIIFSPYILLYEEVTGTPIVSEDQTRLSSAELAGKIKGLEIKLQGQLSQLGSKRAAILASALKQFTKH